MKRKLRIPLDPRLQALRAAINPLFDPASRVSASSDFFADAAPGAGLFDEALPFRTDPPIPGVRPSTALTVRPPVAPAIVDRMHPGLTGVPVPPPPAQPSPFERFVGGAGDAMGAIFGGQDDPSLSPEQNRAARGQAMIMAGLQMLGMSGSGASFGQMLAGGAMAGQGAGAQRRSVMAGLTQRDRIRAVLDDPELMANVPPNVRAVLAIMPEGEAAQLLAEILLAPEPDPLMVPDGTTAVNRKTLQPLFTNEPEPELSSHLADAYHSLGYNPRSATPEQRREAQALAEQNRRAGAQSVTITDTRGQSQKGMTEAQIRDYDALTTAATTAENRIDSLNAMEALLRDGMTTGQLDALTSNWRSLGAEFGLTDTENLARQQLFTALSNKLALEMKGAMTGPMSDRDVQLLKEQAPRLANTVAGNRLLIEVMRRLARREIEIADLADQYAAEHGDSLTGWGSYRRQWVRDNPLDLSDLSAETDRSAPAPWRGR